MLLKIVFLNVGKFISYRSVRLFTVYFGLLSRRSAEGHRLIQRIRS